MGAGDVAATAHKRDFPIPQAGGSPDCSFDVESNLELIAKKE